MDREELKKIDLALSNDAIDWLVKLKSGQATKADEEAFAKWRGKSEAHEAAAKEAELIWHGVGLVGDETIAKERKEKRAKLTRRTLLGGGTLAFAGWAALKTGLVGPRFFADYATGIGERRTIELADGSSVFLNAGTALSAFFSNTERRLTLIEGQASFTVAHDATRPFIVLAEDGRTRAIGTQFDVDIRSENVAVTVIEGVVSVSSGSDSSNRVITKANQRVRYGAYGAPSPPESIDAEKETAWRRGKLIFDHRTLGDVVVEIARYRSGRIIILNEGLRSLPVTGVFDLTDPESILRTIEETLPVQFTHLPFVTVLR